MIDYYLHKKCALTNPTAKQNENVRCKDCIWLDQDIHKCLIERMLAILGIFSIYFVLSVISSYFLNWIFWRRL